MKKKILYVANVASHIKSFHLPYLKMMQDNGYEAYVVSNWNLDKDETLNYCDKFIQVPIQRKPYSIKNIRAIRQLKKIIDKEKFDIIHCHTPMGGVVARIAANYARKKYGTRVIYTAHGFHFYKGAPLKNWLLFYSMEKILAKYTDTLITINHDDYELAKKKFSRRCHDIKYIPGVGINTKKFNLELDEKEKNKFKESLGLNKDDFVLTCVARLDKNKNQGVLIKCMEELVTKHNNIHLLLVGKDELNGYYQSIVKKSNLGSNIHFLGNRDDVPKLLKITDIVVSASEREGLPVNVIESFAAGVPVVAFRCRGMSDLIENDVNGYVVENESEYIDKVYFLIDNSLKYNQMTENNLKKANNYSIDSLFNMYSDIYNLNIKIPKIIHYVWMGGNAKPKNIIKCMNTWKKLKDYKIIEWNEKNFNIDEHPFCKVAYENKKWAFVSDYVRAWAIYNYGGVYFDTDIMVINEKSIDTMLKNDAFVGFESKNSPFTAVFGATKGHPFIKKMLDHYNSNKFDLKTTNTNWVSEILINEYKCKLGNIEQDLIDNVHVYPKEILCEPSNVSVTIHAFTGTWLEKKSIFGKISTFLRLNSNHLIFRLIYSKIVVPIKEKKNSNISKS